MKVCHSSVITVILLLSLVLHSAVGLRILGRHNIGADSSSPIANPASSPISNPASSPVTTKASSPLSQGSTRLNPVHGCNKHGKLTRPMCIAIVASGVLVVVLVAVLVIWARKKPVAG